MLATRQACAVAELGRAVVLSSRGQNHVGMGGICRGSLALTLLPERAALRGHGCLGPGRWHVDAESRVLSLAGLG